MGWSGKDDGGLGRVAQGEFWERRRGGLGDGVESN